MIKPAGRIIIEPGLNVWPHELKTAEALAAAGYTVEFIRKSDSPHVRTADVMMDGECWEFKAPTANQLKAIERNLKRARWQSGNIVFDSRRMKKLPDKAIEREVRVQTKALTKISKLLYINRQGTIIVVK